MDYSTYTDKNFSVHEKFQLTLYILRLFQEIYRFGGESFDFENLKEIEKFSVKYRRLQEDSFKRPIICLRGEIMRAEVVNSKGKISTGEKIEEDGQMVTKKFEFDPNSKVIKQRIGNLKDFKMNMDK